MPEQREQQEQAILEGLLAYACPKQKAAPLSQALLQHFGSLYRVMLAEMDTLMQVEGVSEPVAVLLHLTGQLACHTPEYDRLAPLRTTEALAEYLQPYFAFAQTERVCVLVLDQRRRPIHCTILQEGTSDTVLVPLVPLFRAVHRSSAACCVLAHSHLSGSPWPSRQDAETTRQIAAILSTVGVPLLDHLVFADGAYQSMLELGMLAEEQEP